MKSKYTDPIVMMVVILLATVVLMRDLAKENADFIKNQGQDSFQVAYAEFDNNETLKTLELLGSTSRFVYFYDAQVQQAVVVSPENVSFMNKAVKVKSQKKKSAPAEKQTDAKAKPSDSEK